MRENVGFAGQAAHHGLDILTKGKASGRQPVNALIPVIWRLQPARQAVRTNACEPRHVSGRVPARPDSATLYFVASLRVVMAREDTIPQSKRIGWIGRPGQGRAACSCRHAAHKSASATNGSGSVVRLSMATPRVRERALVTGPGRSRRPLRHCGCTGGHGSPRDDSRSYLRSPESCRFPLQISE